MAISDNFFSPPMPADDAIRRILADRIIASRLSPGIVVGVTESGRRRSVAYGSRDAAGNHPVDAQALFELGSVTKLITSLLLADMAKRREAELDEPVAKLLPLGIHVPERNERSITLIHLAKHLSGLPRLPTNLTPNDPADPYAHYTTEHLYDFLAREELRRTPGEIFEYSKLATGLLGHALSLRAGMDYESLVRARILAPLVYKAPSSPSHQPWLRWLRKGTMSISIRCQTGIWVSSPELALCAHACLIFLCFSKC